MARHSPGRHRSSTWRVTPAGAILLTALVVLLILAIAAPSSPVYAGLALVILMWAGGAQRELPVQEHRPQPTGGQRLRRELRETDARRQRRL